MPKLTAAERAIGIFREAGGILRTREALAKGIHPRTLYELRDRGEIQILDRGVYLLSEHPHSEHISFAIVGRKYRQATVCLISALSWHEITLQMPRRVQIALPPGAQEPRLRWPPLETFRFSGAALTEGIESHEIDGVTVRIYESAKTIADCFKFRNRIGIDVALEALKLCRERNTCHPDRIWQFAEQCRVWNIMRPYVETVFG